MLVEEKYFKQDKNYLMKAVQAFSKDSLLKEWINQLLVCYNIQHNPMGLEDDFIIEVKGKIDNAQDLLYDYYDLIAAIYRYNHIDNQLEFQWDGRSHMEAYDEQWKKSYRSWIISLSLIKEIQRPLIKYAIQGKSTNADFLKSSIRRGILSYFKVKLATQSIRRISA